MDKHNVCSVNSEPSQSSSRRFVTKSFEKKVNDFVLKWENLKVLDERWVKYIRSSHTKLGSMYGLIKTHKENNQEL